MIHNSWFDSFSESFPTNNSNSEKWKYLENDLMEISALWINYRVFEEFEDFLGKNLETLKFISTTKRQNDSEAKMR